MSRSSVSHSRSAIVALIALAAAVGLLAAPLTASAVVTPDSGPLAGGTAVTIDGIHFVQVSAGSDHSLGLTSEGTVYAWGNNTFGALGNASNTSSSTPVQVVGVAGSAAAYLTGVTNISAGDFHSLASTTTGVYAWGRNNFRQLGDGTTENKSSPVRVGGETNTTLTGVTHISAGTSHSLASTTTGMYAWVNNVIGQLGDGSTDSSSTPVRVGGETSTTLNNVTSLSASSNYNSGYSFSLASTPTGVFAWGWNGSGQLGDGTTTSRSEPVRVGGETSTTLNGATNISAGEYHSLASTASGVYAWGNNDIGQLGDGTYDGRLSPVRVGGETSTTLNGVTNISAGYYQSFALTATGVYAWGYNNSGQLGDGSSSSSWTPVPSANFQPVSVRFAGVAATELSNTDSMWSVTSPAGVEGSAPILATANLFGGTTAATPATVTWNAGTFTYLAATPTPDPIVTFPAVNYTAGGTTTVTGTGFPANTPIRVELRSTPVTLGTFTTNNSGGFTTNVTIPRSTPAGNHHIVFVNNVTNHDLSSTAITVASVATDPQTSPGISALAKTGVNASEPLLHGMLLLSLGVVITVITRRRMRSNK